MANVRYVPDHQGTGRLLTSRQMEDLVVARAVEGQAYAESISPYQSGEYRRSFVVESTTRGGPKSDRAEAKLINVSDHATYVEWLNNGGERILGRTVDLIEGGG